MTNTTLYIFLLGMLCGIIVGALATIGAAPLVAMFRAQRRATPGALASSVTRARPDRRADLGPAQRRQAIHRDDRDFEGK
jgi:hypothetical protein